MSGRTRRPPAVARVLEWVSATARRHHMFAPDSVVVVAVSGGPDSISLLHALHMLRRLFRIRLVCFHFDHRLRPNSRADAAYVRRAAARLGVPFHLRVAESGPAKGESPEAWARTARYGALFRVAEELEASAAAVGHTLDDQAETVLLALLRGGGIEALAGMEPVNRPVVRPLLEVSRDETEAFCRALRLRPRRDPMNEDPALMRAAIRTRVVPMLEKAMGRGVRSTLARTAGHLREDAALLQDLADDAAKLVVASDEGPEDRRLQAAGLAGLPVPLASRIVRGLMKELGVLPQASHVEAVIGLAGARRGDRISLPGGLIAVRGREYVRFSRPSPAGSPPARPRR